MARLKKKTLDGNVETLILVVLEGGANYGYRILQELNSKSPDLLALGEGTIYPILHRLEQRGLIRADWRQGETGRERKYYRLTEPGRHVLQANREQFHALVRVMETMLGPIPPRVLPHQTAAAVEGGGP